MHCDKLCHSFSPKFTSKNPVKVDRQNLGSSEEECIENVMLTLKEFE